MINEKELLQAIDKWQESLSPRTDIRDSIIFDTLEAVNATIADIETVDVPDTNVGKWIPCSERLPETYGEYLTSREHCEGYDIGILFFDPKQDFDVEFWKDEIDAWMPLPEPFKESED